MQLEKKGAVFQELDSNLAQEESSFAKYAYLGAYLSAPNMVKWGIPEEILQNAVQMR